MYLIEAYRNGRYVALAVAWIFATEEAADLWIDTCTTGEFEYIKAVFPVYTLEDVKNIKAETRD